MKHKKILIFLITGFVLLTGCNQKKDGQEAMEQPTVTLSITSEPTITPEPTKIEPQRVTETPSKDELVPGDGLITFTGTVEEVTKDGAVVTTSDLNSKVTEKVSLSFDYVEADPLFATAPNQVTSVRIQPDCLKKGDRIKINSEYMVNQGRNIIDSNAYCFVDLIQAEQDYNMAMEKLMGEEGIRNSLIHEVSYCQLNYQPKEFRNAFVVKEEQKDKISALYDVLNSYPVFYKMDVNQSSQEFCPITLTFASKDGVQYHLSWNEEVLYLSDSTSDCIQMYQFYYKHHPNMECISQLFYTRDSVAELVKNCITYEKITEYKEYPMNRGYEIDLDQDGSNEKVFFAPCGDDLWYNRYGESVNFKKGTFECFINNEYCCELNHYDLNTEKFYLLDLDPNDQKLELVFENEGDSGDWFQEFYQYQNHKLVSIGEAQTYGLKVIVDPEHKERKAIAGDKRLSILQTWYANGVWNLDSNGQIKEVVSKLYTPTTTTNFKLLYDISGYKEMNLDSERILIKKGELHALLTDNQKWLQVETKDHQKVWIYIEDGWQVYENDIIDEAYEEAKEKNLYVELFEGLCICD